MYTPEALEARRKRSTITQQIPRWTDVQISLTHLQCARRLPYQKNRDSSCKPKGLHPEIALDALDALDDG